MNKLLPLTIGYSTLANRAKNIKFLSSVNSLVIVQNPEGIVTPTFADEVKVIELKNRGVAKSRNAAIVNTNTDYLIFGDDDIKFSESGIASAINLLNANPHISILLMQAVDETGKLRKSYPSKAHELKLTNSAKAATYEMMIRVSDIKAAGIKFDENFGAGATNYLGDEYIFIADLIDKGGAGVFLPLTIAIHPLVSSGSRWGSDADLRARAEVFQRVFGDTAPLIRIAFYLKNLHKFGGLRNLVRFSIGKF